MNEWCSFIVLWFPPAPTIASILRLQNVIQAFPFSSILQEVQLYLQTTYYVSVTMLNVLLATKPHITPLLLPQFYKWEHWNLELGSRVIEAQTPVCLTLLKVLIGTTTPHHPCKWELADFPNRILKQDCCHYKYLYLGCFQIKVWKYFNPWQRSNKPDMTDNHVSTWVSD